MQLKNTKNINLSIELVSFLAICALLLNFNQSLDPGEVIFAFVYEANIMVLSFSVFFLIFYTYQHTFILEDKDRNVFQKLFHHFVFASIVISIFLLTSFLVLLLLNQINIELLIGYLENSNYRFKSLDILGSGDVYLSSSVRVQLEKLFGKSYALFFWITGIKYFVVCVIHFFGNEEKNKNEFITFSGLTEIISQILVSPIALLIACFFIVVLHALYGNQNWIVFLSLSIFRLLFLFLFSKTNRFIKSIK